MDGPECFNWQIYGSLVCSHDTHHLLYSDSPLQVWNLVCGFAQNESELLVFRFFAGIGGSAPLVVCDA